MPRKARIDAPGAVHHVMVRGIERRKIFGDNQDRNNWIERMGAVLEDTAMPCFAWVASRQDDSGKGPAYQGR